MVMHRRTIRARFFTLVSVLLFGIAVLSMLSGCGSNRKYTITGRITSGGTAFNNVRVTLTPDGSSQVVATTVTDADGNYSFQDVTGGTYQLTPSPTNNTFFSPPFRKVYLDGLDALGFNFSSSNEGRLAASTHTVFIKNDGTVWTWGKNDNGQLGDGTTTQRTSPVQVPGLSGIVAVAAGDAHTVALRGSDGTVWTWGKNDNGQLGDGTTTQRTSPVQVPGLSGVIAIAAGGSHTVVIQSDHTVWCWGNNANNQLGNNSTIQSSVPVQAIGLTNAIAIAAGSTHTVALKSDNTVWTWGGNGNGQLGIGNTTQNTVPVQVGSIANVIAIAAGGTHTIAVRNDITRISVWTWGNNASGQLGIGNTTQSTYPVQVSNLTNVTTVSGGADFSVAMKDDGTVWTWGNNSNGQLGIGNTTQSLLPVQAGGLSTVTAIAAGTIHSAALQNDGTVWTWGGNGNGQLGNGNTTDALNAVQLPLF